ncbi:MAG: SMC-Scp complex subunit ScpB [Pseudomonadota bacterium]
MEKEKIKSIIESILFVSSEPVSNSKLREIIGKDYGEIIKEAIEELEEDFDKEYHGIALENVANGWQFRTKEENAQFIINFKKIKPQRISKASMDTLAIIAYQQPITKAEVEKLRGVDSSGVIKMLLARKLIRIIGKKEEAGRPMIYGTSSFFLESLGLKNLKDLPPLSEFEEAQAVLDEDEDLEEGEVEVEVEEEIENNDNDVVHEHEHVHEHVHEHEHEHEKDEGEEIDED